MRNTPTRAAHSSNVVEDLLAEVRARFALLRKAKGSRAVEQSFIDHLRSVARWNEQPMDYPKVSKPKYPPEILIAFAVCHPECGARQFIVEGSTQECDHCGGNMYRTDAPVRYRRVDTSRVARRTAKARAVKRRINAAR